MPAKPVRPVIFVLAGVNGAGKSSVGGAILKEHGLEWFNPDTFSRERLAQGIGKDEADAEAWAYGKSRLEGAIAGGADFAFETTLGGKTIAARILEAARSHDVLVWFCGLSSPELHLARVAARVACGGHDIPEAKIRERYPHALANLIALMPHLAHLQIHDNSTQAAADGTVPDPILLLEMENGRPTWPAPDDLRALQRTPEWAKPLLEAAFALPANEEKR